ncbi:MAG: methionyl-tRNA formyltransferase, partial [Synechococcales cyanobacterium]
MIKVVFFGTPQFAVASLQALLNSDCCQVVGVVTQPDKHRGRGQQLSPSPVKGVAVDHGLPVFQPQR